ncbi:Gfo/Idh/MocA family oxidoreductase [Treponema sp. OMZ 840]|uniref:Gfo/Idh/MocA family protein n=1 Tax=Treponema sp. OMZ 840 TaxID=244313 RepID=UPI003D9058F9
MVKIGIIGCGKIAQMRHIPEYLDNKNARIIGITDMNEKRAHSLAALHNWKLYKTYRELLADPDIAAVSVCTANHTHSQITIDALRAGKHVLCEKPMAVSLDECNAMVFEAQKHKKILMIGHNQRLTKAHLKARRLIKDGVIGKPITFRTTFGHGGPETWSIDPGKDVWFFNSQKAGMGAMGDLGIHKTDLIQYLLDDRIVETFGCLATIDKNNLQGQLIDVDDNAICIYRMKSGAIGTMSASWTYYGQEDNSTVIYGSKGIMKIYDDPSYSLKVIMKNGDEILYNLDRIQTNAEQSKSGIIDEFVSSVAADKESKIDGVSVLAGMRAVFASIESSKKGRVIKIDENH